MRTPLESLLKDTKIMKELGSIHDLPAGAERLTSIPVEAADLRRAVELLETPSPSGLESGFSSFGAMEAIIIPFGRPALFIQDGAFEEPALEEWRQRLNPNRQNIERAIASVGRVELRHHPSYDWVGTAWVIDKDILVTNRHVAETFARKDSGRFVIQDNPLGQKVDVNIDFREEYRRSHNFEFPVAEVIFIEEAIAGKPDMALMKIEAGNSLPDPMSIDENIPDGEDEYIAAIGYPARDGRNERSVMARVLKMFTM